MTSKIIMVVMLVFFVLASCGVVEKLANKLPIINSVTAEPRQIGTQDTTTLKVIAEDPDDDLLSFHWDDGSVGELLSDTESEVKWVAPEFSGKYRIEVTVKDENGGETKGGVYVTVKGDESPVVSFVRPLNGEIIPGIGKYAVEVNVAFDFPIARVDFFMNDSLIYSDESRPYQFADWDVTRLAGEILLRAVAFDQLNPSNFGQDSVRVFVEGVVPVPKRRN
ncbi:MAG: hypothetical protein GXO74_01840 [Calditrichaeota bacterium]|nr:hypothetical protein [Calditrichota bacterium]